MHRRRWIAAALAAGLALPACARTGTEATPGTPATPGTAAVPARTPMVGSLPGDLVPAFRATVRRAEGGTVREEPLDSRATPGATVYIVTSTRCPYCNADVDRMKGIEAAYMPKGVDVIHVYPNRAEPAAEKTAWHAEKGFRGGQVLDADASIARLLDANKTPTAYLVDGSGVIVYRGALAESGSGGGAPIPWLAEAIDQHLAGKPVAVPSTEPEG
jgi:hypothetical protein